MGTEQVLVIYTRRPQAVFPAVSRETSEVIGITGYYWVPSQPTKLDDVAQILDNTQTKPTILITVVNF